jgi:hypothetical protein
VALLFGKVACVVKVFCFIITYSKEKETLQVLKDFTLWICLMYNVKVNTIRLDNKLGRKKTLKWL